MHMYTQENTCGVSVNIVVSEMTSVFPPTHSFLYCPVGTFLLGRLSISHSGISAEVGEERESGPRKTKAERMNRAQSPLKGRNHLEL